jgi:hypothetical protein
LGLSPPESARAQPKPLIPARRRSTIKCPSLLANPLGQTSCARGSITLAWTFALPNASPPQQPPPLPLSSWSQRRQISPPLNACLVAPVERGWSVKRRRWCGIDDRGGNRQGGGTAALVVVRQQLAGRAVVSVTSWRQRQCWQWFWRATIGTGGLSHGTYLHYAKN